MLRCFPRHAKFAPFHPSRLRVHIVTNGSPAHQRAIEPSLRSAGSGPVDPIATTALRPLPFDAIKITDGFLHKLQRENGSTSIRQGHTHIEHQKAWTNFENAAARRVGEPYHGPVFEDGEAFKWLEAVAWEEGRAPAADLDEWLGRYSALSARAQAEDGYLSTYNQASGKRGRYEWISYDHEIFNMATMIQAAVARYRATGRVDLLDVARRAADHMDATFGWGKREELCGHPLIEMALVELYRVTEEPRYLEPCLLLRRKARPAHADRPDLAGLDLHLLQRSHPGARDRVSGRPRRARGVLRRGRHRRRHRDRRRRATSALRKQWDNMVASKMYINGSLGSRWEGEAFGDPYELPTDRGYGETCAAIASMQWSWRLLLATGEAKYADLIERQLYNAVLSGVSLDGGKYFYVNALQVRSGAVPFDSRMPASGRKAWFGCSCCPTNLMRTVSTVHQYVATGTAGGVQIHQFASADVRSGSTLIKLRTNYPWSGDVTAEVASTAAEPWEFAVRIPGWAAGASLEVNGEPIATTAGEYARVSRRWQAGDRLTLRLPMEARQVHGHHRVDAVRGAVAIERGPLVYAIEQVDQAAEVTVDDVELLRSEQVLEERAALFGGIPALKLPARVGPRGPRTTLTAIPYFMWANREVGPMRVWLPLSETPD